MHDSQHLIPNHEIRLTSPDKAPFTFNILIKEENEEKSTNCLLEIAGKDKNTNLPITCRYTLSERNHHSYLNFFEKLAQGFGLRLPLNRQETGIKPTFTARFREVLTNNLTPAIWYGYGDPAVIRVKDTVAGEKATYYLLATSNDAPDSFPILRSQNLLDWELVDFVFPAGQKPGWAAEGELISDYWAPEMHRIGEEYQVYFVARDKRSRELCIGIARAPRPEGPYVSDKEPIIGGNVIDPHVYVQDAHTAFLYWKEDNNDVWPGKLIQLLYQNPELISQLFALTEDQITASFTVTLWPWAQTLEPMERFLINQIFIEAVIARYLEFYELLQNIMQAQAPGVKQEIQVILQFMKTPMYAQQLAPDGTGLVGKRTKIIENDLAWEAHLVEGMWVTKQENKYYLFYAGNDFSTDQYGIGVAVADSPLGPYRKMPQPLLQSTPQWWAPGHPSVVTGPGETPVLILHAYFPGKAGYKQFRAVLAADLVFEGDQVFLK